MEEFKKLSKHKINHNIHDHMNQISKEFRQGFEMLRKYPKSVSIFGSSRSTPMSPHYKEAQNLAYRIVKELDYSIITGGGPGIMAAANLGAKEAEGNSIGLNIDLPGNEQHINPYITSSIHFKYFFARKTMLSFAAEAYVFFPGGYGTMDEFFNIITLIQTKKIPKIPVILFGKDFWNHLKEFMALYMVEKHHAIREDEMDLFTISDSIDKTLEIIKNAPIANWWETDD